MMRAGKKTRGYDGPSHGKVAPGVTKSDTYGDTAGASRFFTQTRWTDGLDLEPFYFQAKPAKKEKNAGLEHLPVKTKIYNGSGKKPGARRPGSVEAAHSSTQANFHATVKPVELLRILIRLAVPEGEGRVVLDPFLGSGTTAVAAILEGREWVGCEMTEEYWPIIEGRRRARRSGGRGSVRAGAHPGPSGEVHPGGDPMTRSTLLRAAAGFALAAAALVLPTGIAGAQSPPSGHAGTGVSSVGITLGPPHIHISRQGSTSLLTIVGPALPPTFPAGLVVESAPNAPERCVTFPVHECEFRGLHAGVAYLYRIRIFYNPGAVSAWSPWTREVRGRLNPLKVRVPLEPLEVTVGSRTFYRLHTTGGFGADSYTILVGSLPAGLRLTTRGVIVGTPLPGATLANPLIVVTDRWGRAETFRFPINVLAASSGTTTTTTPTTTTTTPVVIQSGGGGGGGGTRIQPLEVGSLPPATATGTYNEPLAISGGTGPYTCTATGLPPTLTLDPTTCQLSGTVPTSPGSYNIVVTVTDGAGNAASSTLTLTVVSEPTLTATTLPPANIGTSYATTITANGGTSPYTYAVTSGALPAGLTLDSTTGQISGTPSLSAVDSTFTLTTTDANGVTASQSYALTVSPQPVWATQGGIMTVCAADTCGSPLLTPGGAVNIAYEVLGGDPSTTYTYSVTGGVLPTGLTLSPTGLLTGTLASSEAAGDYSTTVTVTDSNGVFAVLTVDLYVVAPPQITTTGLPAATQGQPYTFTINGAGGVASFVWSATGLPAGLILYSNPAGTTNRAGGSATLTGTPTQGGTFTVDVTATDDNGASTSSTFTLTVAPAPVISTASLAAATQGQPYSATLAASGGTASYIYAITSGVLPAGLTLDPSTGQISGTLGATAATETFTVSVSGADGATSSTTLTIAVNPPPVITTTSLPAATVGAAYSATLAASGGTAPLVWSLTSGNLPSGLSLDPSTGVISGNVSASAPPGTYTVTVAVTDANGAVATATVTLTVAAA